MWNQPYLETCCRAALHRLFLAADGGRPSTMLDGACLRRIAGMDLAAQQADGRFRITCQGAIRHASEILHRPQAA
jgi:hypothetical protein